MVIDESWVVGLMVRIDWQCLDVLVPNQWCGVLVGVGLGGRGQGVR